MTQNNSAFVLPADASLGGVISVFGQTITERITAESSGGAYQVIDELTPPGMGVPPHQHSLEDEVVFIRAGVFDVYLDGKITQAGPGAILNFARGTMHGFRCVGPAIGETTWLITPGLNFQTFMRAVAAFPPGPPDFAKLDALHAKHGIGMPAPKPGWW